VKIINKIKDIDIAISTNVISNNQISFIIESSQIGSVQFYVADVIGRILQYDKIEYQKGIQENIININPDIPKGIYLLKFSLSNKSTPFVFKIIK
jgi:hypothetical protein